MTVAPFLVAFNGEADRFVVSIGNRIIVIRRDGGVFGHDINGSHVGPPFAFTGSKVAYNGEADRFVVAMGNRIIVVRRDGGVFGHDVSGNNVGNGFAFTGSKVAFNGEADRFVVTIGNRIIVLRRDGFVWVHNVSGNNVPGAFPMNFDLGAFTFESSISTADRDKLIDRHRFALARVASCGNLSQSEKDALNKAYEKVIHHGINTNPEANASSPVGGARINVNFSNLFPQGDVEIAQTLIHEMMHCAGFSHPDRRDPPAGKSCSDPGPHAFDCPHDNGPYFGTPPLRAELCIAGDQDDLQSRVAIKAANESCSIDADGLATLGTV